MQVNNIEQTLKKPTWGTLTFPLLKEILVTWDNYGLFYQLYFQFSLLSLPPIANQSLKHPFWKSRESSTQYIMMRLMTNDQTFTQHFYHLAQYYVIKQVMCYPKCCCRRYTHNH